ncbi:MAG TPA: TonB family protein [Chitinispirillaceae bacterium]|nr:TonB family protein [Chitinispirillaceae bacterium]
MHITENVYERRSMFDEMFPLLLIVVCGCLIGLGLYFKKIGKNVTLVSQNTVSKIQTQFILPQTRAQPVVPKVQEIKTKKTENIEKKEKEVVDLSQKPQLAQNVEDVQERKPQDAKPVRKVFGLKRVYSQGLGAGGSLSDAVIGKLGNTINTEVDTFTATEQELKGQVVSTTTVTQAPRFKKVVKPEYTKEMIDNRVEGTVKLKVLVDIDGKVKKATVLSDIGFTSAQQAVAATMGMEFIPAMRGEEAVAVWIIIPIKFVMLS